MLGIADLPDGFSIAVELLAMRLSKKDKLGLDAETISLGRELLARFDFQGQADDLSYYLSEIASSCLQGPDGYDAALKLCRRFAHDLSDYSTGAWNYSTFAGMLFHLQPQAALDTFLSNGEGSDYTPLLLRFGVYTENPVNRATIDALLAWADRDPVDRYPKLASEIRLFDKCGDTSELTWTPLALHLLEEAPDLPRMLKIFSTRMRQSSGWLDSSADTLARYIGALQKLANARQLDPLVAAWTQCEEDNLMRQIAEERQRERRVDESFE